MLEWTNGNWHVEVTKYEWQVFFKSQLIMENGNLFVSRNVPFFVQKKVNELVKQFGDKK